MLGVYVSERVFLGRTFITYDMAHEGIQADTLRKGDENRLQLEIRATSSRDMIKYSREAERITHKTEQEDREQKWFGSLFHGFSFFFAAPIFALCLKSGQPTYSNFRASRFGIHHIYPLSCSKTGNQGKKVRLYAARLPKKLYLRALKDCTIKTTCL